MSALRDKCALTDDPWRRLGLAILDDALARLTFQPSRSRPAHKAKADAWDSTLWLCEPYGRYRLTLSDVLGLIGDPALDADAIAAAVRRGLDVVALRRLVQGKKRQRTGMGRGR